MLFGHQYEDESPRKAAGGNFTGTLGAASSKKKKSRLRQPPLQLRALNHPDTTGSLKENAQIVHNAYANVANARNSDRNESRYGSPAVAQRLTNSYLSSSHGMMRTCTSNSDHSIEVSRRRDHKSISFVNERNYQRLDAFVEHPSHSYRKVNGNGTNGNSAMIETIYASVWKHLRFRKKMVPLASSTDIKPICVTGVDTFLASWIVAELLEKGYRVRGTLQSSSDDIFGILRLPLAKNFTVVETSLLTPEACDLAVHGCDFVIHTGTPTSCSVRDPVSEQQEPAVHSIGSRMHCIIPMMSNFIQACARARVKRVVLTSSIAAMADTVTLDSIINDSCWNIVSSLDRNPHFLSLKLAEEAAWQLVDQLPRDCRIDLVTINSGTLFGPSLSKSRLAPGNQVIFDLVTGQYSALVDLNWSMVDVRDCARAHIAALENVEARGRYICVNRTVWMKEIVDILAGNGYSGRDLPWRVGLPNWAARLPAYSAHLGQVGASLYRYDPNNPHACPYINDKILESLHVSFRDVRTTLVEATNDLLKWGFIKPWAEDHEAINCACCKMAFTFYRRRHHCRECGVIICADCSMSRAVIDGAERKARLCDKCVKNSIPGLLNLLRSPILTNKRKSVIALKSLMDNETNHEYLTRLGGLPHLFAAMHCGDETIATDAAGALCALSTSDSSTLQMVLEGAVLQLLEVSETSSTWPCCLRALRNIWKQVNRPSFRRMLYAVARITSYTSVGELRSNVLLTFVHMMDTEEVSSLLEEGLLVVLYLMLQSEHIFPRCAAAHAIKHLIPSSYSPNLTIEIPPYIVDDHEELFANVSLSDLQFLVKGHIAPINAHKVVLFFRNAYFKEMFGSATSQKEMIEIDNCSYEVFSMLLRFLYTGKVDITRDVAEELLQASSTYRVYELQKRAEHFLSREIRVENVVNLLCLAEECQALDLKRNCVPYLMQHIHDVVRLPAYAENRIRTTDEIFKALSETLGSEWKQHYDLLKEELDESLLSTKSNSQVYSSQSSITAMQTSSSSSSGPNPRDMWVPMSQEKALLTREPTSRSLIPQSSADYTYLKQFGYEDLQFRRRGLSDELSESISEGVC